MRKVGRKSPNARRGFFVSKRTNDIPSITSVIGDKGVAIVKEAFAAAEVTEETPVKEKKRVLKNIINGKGERLFKDVNGVPGNKEYFSVTLNTPKNPKAMGPLDFAFTG